MIEVECNLKIDSKDHIESMLKELGFKYVKTVYENDTYFDNEDGYVRNHDSALRIRVTKEPDINKTTTEVNFKGAKFDNRTMTRPEYETVVSDPAILEKILNSIGYFGVEPKVNKARVLYELSSNTYDSRLISNSSESSYSVTACLDTVDGLGDYLELEILVDDECEKDTALERIDSLLNKIGYSIDDSTTTSYLSALQNRSN